jgi:hypothetical protein
MESLPKVGTQITVDLETGKVTQVQPGSMTLLPPAPGKCQECAVEHEPDQPHDQQSLYYQMAFKARHGRWPTWSDAMAHCTPKVQRLWRETLILMMKRNNMAIPADLLPTPSQD